MALLDANTGSVGYLVKEQMLEMATLTDALRRVAAGECVIDPLIVRELMTRLHRVDAYRGRLGQPPRRGALTYLRTV